jgi:hypothetical protein
MNISQLPDEIKYIILQFVRIKELYKFDVDCVFSYIEPHVFISDRKLNIAIYSWFGTRNPKEYKCGSILHTIFNRPYNKLLERSFSNLSKILYKNLERFKLRNDVIDISYGKILFAGTHGPLNKGLESEGGVEFNKLSNVCFNYSTSNLIEYFKEIELIDSELDILNDKTIIYVTQKLRMNLLSKIRESINEYNKRSSNHIGIITLKKIKYDKYYYYKMFFNICKKKSDEQKLIELKIQKKIINNIT